MLQHNKLSSISSNPSGVHNSCKQPFQNNCSYIRTAALFEQLEFWSPLEVQQESGLQQPHTQTPKKEHR